MNRSSNSHSRLFLMELIVAILFFSLSSAICLRMFVSSRQLSKDTTALNMAINQSSNVAELLKYAQTEYEPFPGCLLGAYPYAKTDTAQAAVYFDEGWNHCPMEQAAFFIQITQEEESDGMVPYDISAFKTTDSENAIYSINIKLHAPIRP